MWIRECLEFLASVFGIDSLTYRVLSNHLQLVLRSRPDVVTSWSDEEVARRWLRLYPLRRNQDGSPAEPAKAEIDSIVNDPEKLSERRLRLSDISWWMRCTAEKIAVQSDREDEVTGHFREGRYRSQQLLDEASVLAWLVSRRDATLSRHVLPRGSVQQLQVRWSLTSRKPLSLQRFRVRLLISPEAWSFAVIETGDRSASAESASLVGSSWCWWDSSNRMFSVSCTFAANALTRSCPEVWSLNLTVSALPARIRFRSM